MFTRPNVTVAELMDRAGMPVKVTPDPRRRDLAAALPSRYIGLKCATGCYRCGLEDDAVGRSSDSDACGVRSPTVLPSGLAVRAQVRRLPPALRSKRRPGPPAHAPEDRRDRGLPEGCQGAAPDRPRSDRRRRAGGPRRPGPVQLQPPPARRT